MIDVECCLCTEEVADRSDRRVSEAWAGGREIYVCEPCQAIVDGAADRAAAFTTKVVARARLRILVRHQKGLFKRALTGVFDRWKLFDHTVTRGWHLAGECRSKVYESFFAAAKEKP